MTKRNIWRAACLGVLGIVAVYSLTVGREGLQALMGELRGLGPWVFFSVFAISISFGVPPTPFLLAAGAAFSLQVNLIGLSAAYIVSLTIAYAYAQRLFKAQLEKFIRTKAPFLATLLQENPYMTILLVRLTPGFPYVLQNCFLVAVAPSLRMFLVISLPPILLMSILLASLGKSLLAGQFTVLFVLIFLLCAIAVAFRYYVRKRVARAQPTLS